jgi:hypothetical protein
MRSAGRQDFPHFNINMEIRMSKFFTLKNMSALAAFSLLVGCTGPQPTPYSGLSSASYLKPNTDGPAKIPYAYTTQVNWQNYSKVIIDPVTIYQGADNQFGSMSQSDQQDLADYMQKKFTEKLSEHFSVVSTPDANTLHIKLTLTGAVKSTPLLSTALHLDMAGNLYNAVQLVRGGPAIMTGSVMYSVEIYDAQSSQLLEAYVTKQYPNSENILASFGSLGAAKVGIDKGANALLNQLGEGS